MNNLKFLSPPSKFLFFTGKGGVGKTSIACASALKLCAAGKNVLLVSTDPASNIGQIFNQQIGNRLTNIEKVVGLTGLEIDPQSAAETYRNRVLESVQGVLSTAGIQHIQEQLSGACTTEIAAFDEFTALLLDSELTLQYDHIIFDTAPTGHTIRLLQLPGAWSQFLETGKGDASCLGPLAGLEKQRLQYKTAVDALSDPKRTRLILVARAQASALREVARTYEELATLGIKQQYLVINGLLSKDAIAGDPLAMAIFQREHTALQAMPENLRALPTDKLFLKPFNLIGLDALYALFEPNPDIQPISLSGVFSQARPELSDLIDGLIESNHGSIMLMGKGGVGKTTMAAAIAVKLVQLGFEVQLTTSDPAAHLSETLTEQLDHLEVSRIDPQVEIERYRQHVLDTRGAKMDEQQRALLEEDLQSPCTEEIAVFQAFSRIIRQASKKFVVMDTAPTGHTLLLLDTTGAYHRDITRQMGDKHLHVNTPMMQLQDPNQTKVIIVTLPETTPILEAADLQNELERAGIKPWAWVVNQSLLAANPRAPLLVQRALNEQSQIELVADQHSQRYAVVPIQQQEPVGLNGLLRLMEKNPGKGL